MNIYFLHQWVIISWWWFSDMLLLLMMRKNQGVTIVTFPVWPPKFEVFLFFSLILITSFECKFCTEQPVFLSLNDKPWIHQTLNKGKWQERSIYFIEILRICMISHILLHIRHAHSSTKVMLIRKWEVIDSSKVTEWKIVTYKSLCIKLRVGHQPFGLNLPLENRLSTESDT